MRRSLSFYLAAFASIFALEVVPLLFAGPPLGVVPGLVLFSFFAAIIPSAFAFAGFAVGRIFHRGAASQRYVSRAGALLALGAAGARYLASTLNASTQLTGLVFFGLLFFGGLIVSIGQPTRELMARNLRSDAGPRFIRVALAFAEGALFVFPLLALLPFALAVLVVENLSKGGRLVIGIVVLFGAAAALIALLRILKTFVASRGGGLERVPRSWWFSAAGGAALVLIGTIIWILERYTILGGGAHSVLGIGILGLPALLPWLHMMAESRYAANKTMEPTR